MISAMLLSHGLKIRRQGKSVRAVHDTYAHGYIHTNTCNFYKYVIDILYIFVSMSISICAQPSLYGSFHT